MRKPLGLAGLIAAAFLLLHLPFLPASLEDLDSVNFALGMREFDVSRHQPHPPGYPVLIAAAKGVNALVGNEARALGYLGIVSGAFGAFALVALFRRWEAGPRAERWAGQAALLTVTAPLYWLTAARPLSDMMGLAAALGVQALTLAAGTGDRLAIAALFAGLASGIRSQVVWLTWPLLVLAVVRRPRKYRFEDAVVSVGALGIGVLLWFVPLVWASGGPAAYWRALAAQGDQDLTGVGMLWTTHTVAQARLAAESALVAPWGTPLLAAVVLILAAAGVWRLLREAPRTLGLLVVAFGPYVAFDLLFQESVTTRYALPLVVPLAYLAVRGAAVLSDRPALGVVGALAGASFFLGAVNVAAFSQAEAPAFQALNAMRAAAPRLGAPPVVGVAYPALRALTWVNADTPSWSQPLPSVPKKEWLEVVKHLRSGSRVPVWYVADPARSDLALIDHGPPRAQYRWGLTLPILIGGSRPYDADWYVFDRPAWMLGEGWALTPETAGMAEVSGRGRGRAPSQGWVLRGDEPVTFAIGGRNFGGSPAAVTLTVDGTAIDTRQVAPGFFFYMLTADVKGADDYAEMTIATTGDAAVEQFDAQRPDKPVFGYADGWQEREYDSSTGRLWRWMSERGQLRVRGVRGRSLAISLEGATETFSRPSHVTIKVDDQVVARQDAGAAFAIRAEIPAAIAGDGAAHDLTIETDQFYVPAERSSRTADRRHLGLKVFSFVVSPR